MKRGLFIAIEGGDKAGKETQTSKLVQALALDNFDVYQIGYPDYSSYTGSLISEMLNDGGRISKQDFPDLFQGIQTLNRYETQLNVEKALMEGKIIISDRYYASSLVYGSLDGVDMDWVNDISHSLIKPDLTIILDITDEEYLKRCSNYEHLDLYEKDTEFMKKVRETYRQLAEVYGWVVLDGNLGLEQIHENIYNLVAGEIFNYGLK